MNWIFICLIDKSIKSIYNVSIINNVTVWMNVNYYTTSKPHISK